jgi:hypothetical protein
VSEKAVGLTNEVYQVALSLSNMWVEKIGENSTILQMQLNKANFFD